MSEKKAIKKSTVKKTVEKPKKEVKKEEKTDVKKEIIKAKPEVKKEFKANLPKDKSVAIKSFETVLHPLITEKSIGMIESENKLVFVVKKTAAKDEIKKAVEDLYKIKVDKINVLRDLKGRKRAFVKINKEFKADEIATKLGVL